MEGLDVAVLEADLLEVVQSQGAENVLWKLLDVVSIHDENLHMGNYTTTKFIPDYPVPDLHTLSQFSEHFNLLVNPETIPRTFISVSPNRKKLHC